MIIFESRKTSHVPLVVENNVLEVWGLHFNNTSEENQKSFEIGISSLKEELLNLDKSKMKDIRVYLYKPESYLHPTYLKTLASALLELSKVGVEVVIESNSGSLVNEFGYQIELGCVSKDGFKVSLEVEKDGKPYFLDLYYDDEGILNGKKGYNFPSGYFN